MQTSDNGLAFIKANEGLVLVPTPDSGKLAIGHGHDIQPGETFPEPFTEADADALLRHDLATRFEPVVNRLAPDANQNQFDALVDFSYNLGTDALKTMLGHGWENVPTEIPRWIYAGGVIAQGLVKRRQAEVDLFLSA